MLRRVLVLCAFLVFSSILTPAAWSQVLVVGQLGDVEASAASDCPADTPREPDFHKGYTHDLVDYAADLTAQMDSGCGAASMNGILDVDIVGSTITCVFEAASSLQDHGGGYARVAVGMTFEVSSPTAYVLTALASTTETGDPDSGGIGLTFASHSALGLDEFDLRWEGVLQPGRYAVNGGADSSRSARELHNDQVIFQNGETRVAGSFELTFTDASVVAAAPVSISAVKARF